MKMKLLILVGIYELCHYSSNTYMAWVVKNLPRLEDSQADIALAKRVPKALTFKTRLSAKPFL